MPSFYFYVNDAGVHHPSSFFFTSKDYISLHQAENVFSFYLCNTRQQELASIHFEITGTRAVSFTKAPFGSLDTYLQEDETLISFWREVEGTLKDKQVSAIDLRFWPLGYQFPNQEFLLKFFKREGFEEAYSDYNFHLEVSTRTGLEIFKKPERKRLRKCIRHGFEFFEWPLGGEEEMYDKLREFRFKKSIPLHIDKNVFLNSTRQFPQRYISFGVRYQGRLVGVSVCVRVNEQILYHFCLAADPDYNAFSPSVMLYDGIYSYCRQHGYLIFDFGTASIQGVKQDGLCLFKEKLGGMVSLKPVLTKLLA